MSEERPLSVVTDSNGRGPNSHDPSSRADGGVHFDETVALSDTGYSGLSALTTGIALVSMVVMVVVVPLSILAFFGFVAVVSGNSIGALVTTVASGVSLPVLLFLVVFGLLLVGTPLVAVLVVVRRGSLGQTDEVHTRVTDDGVEIDREGGYFGQSSGVTVPFGAITAVEYSDPDGDLKVNLGDVRAEKFIGGRAGDWVRIGRSDGPAVYVGSDRPRALAEVVADLSPNVDGAEPFS